MNNLVKPTYAEGYVDRHNNIKLDESKFNELYYKENSIVIAVKDENVFVNKDFQDRAIVNFSSVDKKRLKHSAKTIAYLGTTQQQPIFSIEGDCLQDNQFKDLARKGAFIDLRSIASAINNKTASLFAYAKGLIQWHINSRYCNKCGSSTKSMNSGRHRQCMNKTCRIEYFPRIDPVIITLVEHISNDGSIVRCLLGRNTCSPVGSYSTFAGFVEIGETFEQAVHRELHEEVAINVDEINYQGTQPWPFPHSIMIGFRASTKSLSFCVDKIEIDEARWFKPEDIWLLSDRANPQSPVKNSPYDSISRILVETWAKERIKEIV